MTNPLNTAIDKHFLTSDALKRAELLARHGRSSAEGWFKGEMIAVLDALAKDGTVDGWRADVALAEDNKQRADFRIVASGRPLWLEVKTLVDPAKQAADIGFLGKGASFTDDLVKLLRAPDGDKAVLLFVLPRPSPDHWTELLATYQRRITPITFAEQSNIADYPPPLYVCKLTLKEMF
jgi:hypothetical protein